MVQAVLSEKVLFHRINKLIASQKLLVKGDTLVVGVSGGPDSVALLHLMKEVDLDLNIFAIYVNHGLRPHETPKEIKLVDDICRKLNLDFKVVKIDTYALKQHLKLSLEEAARILRYQKLESLRANIKAKAIAVGHTADDQAEELLIRLIRGTGRKGLSGMDIKNGYIIRPLLRERKASLTSYLNKKNISYCQDSSNKETTFLRNKIRLELLPYLEQGYNGSIRQNLLQLADILHHEEELLESLAQKDFQKVVSIPESMTVSEQETGSTLTLDVCSFQECHPAMQRRILEKICWLMKSRPGFRQIEQLRNLIQKGEEGAEIHLKKGLRIQKKGISVFFSYPLGKKSFRGSTRTEPVEIHQHIPGPGNYYIDGIGLTLNIQLMEYPSGQEFDKGLMLDADSIQFPLLLRTAHEGEKFTPFGMKGRKKISRFFSDKKIPLSKRHLYPVLISESNLLALAGQEIDHHYRLRPETKTILVIVWQ